MHFSERVLWEIELAAAREGMLNTKGKRLPDPGQLDVTNDLHIRGKKLAMARKNLTKRNAMVTL